MKQTQLALADPAEWLGDWHPLAEQLGSADGLVALSSVSALLCLSPVRDRASSSHTARVRAIEGLSTAEVAGILGSSETTVRSQISTARLKIRKALKRRRP